MESNKKKMKKAVLVGVISRGAECGEKDQPGIAAREDLACVNTVSGLEELTKKLRYK